VLAILTTHPIQYQVPLWQMLARDSSIPFEVWYLTKHATRPSRDREFKQEFAWDIDMLKDYPHRFLKTPSGATPDTFWRCRGAESLTGLFEKTNTKVLWVQGWQVAAYWQGVWAANRAGLQVWLRGESNNLAPEPPQPKRAIKRFLLGQLFRRVDHFLCIGAANKALYRSYGVPESKLHTAPYAVDNERFAAQANQIRNSKVEIRKQWRIPDDAYCVLFCGKFIPKKRPLDLIKAAQLLTTDNSLTDNRTPNVHLLFVGSGELGNQMRAHCNVVFDAERATTDNRERITDNQKPRASFAGFLNQTEISKAYVAADVLVLPSNYAETWGLVVNEAMASGLLCIISDRCGCAPDLGRYDGNSVFQYGKVPQLADHIADLAGKGKGRPTSPPPSLHETVDVVRFLNGSRLPDPPTNSCH
jgi:glycosyltransferase involved in cell wall biosynthesis